MNKLENPILVSMSETDQSEMQRILRGGHVHTPRPLTPLAGAQSRLGSFYEACINIVIGFTINFCANMLIFPLFGMHISYANNFWMGGIYTVISLVRSYAIRRWFNARLHRLAEKMAGGA